MAKCRGCGREIIWIKTAGNKSMPCDPEQVTYWHGKGFRIVTPNGEVHSCSLSGEPNNAVGVGYIPHWATCQNANDFRQKKADGHAET